MAPGGLVEVRVSWPEHPRYLQKKKKITLESPQSSAVSNLVYFSTSWTKEIRGEAVYPLIPIGSSNNLLNYFVKLGVFIELKNNCSIIKKI